MVEKKENDDVRAVFHLSITPNEKKRIKEIAEVSNMSMSEFVRQAIFDKITRIENPDIKSTTSKDNGLILDYMKKHDSRLNKLEKLLRERLSNGKVIKSTLAQIRSRVETNRLEAEKNIVKNLIKNKPMNQKEIIEVLAEKDIELSKEDFKIILVLIQLLKA